MNKPYWNAFYAANKAVNEPSLFAQWVMGQMEEGKKVVDLGCGNGRDSIFFMENGMDVYSVDASEVATDHIAKCYQDKIHVENEDFILYLGKDRHVFDYLYSRFTIHAILEEEQKVCIQNAYKALKPNGKLFIEVRCTKDELFGKGELVAKNTYFYNGHNRRFIEKDELLSDLQDQGFTIEYAEEKKGFAPFGNMDPIILRVVAKKSKNKIRRLDERLQLVKKHINEGQITVMILGLGSVGTYLLDFLMSRNDEAMRIVVVGRNLEKMENNVNIVRISSLIRHLNRSEVVIESGVDFNNAGQIADCIRKYEPDFIVNSSRVYSGLKYGSISWTNLRAYGIWSPLAMKYIRNIMEACEIADIGGIVINTSYSDAVIPWLKTAGHAYPDFGSGNINHLIPRIKYAVAEIKELPDFWNVDVMYATAHFHDVVISKEGHTEGVPQLLKVFYQGEELEIDQKEIFVRCKIPMPTDEKRNMMNASSNYDIITSIIDAVRKKEIRKIFSPGVFGEIGGYPVQIDAAGEQLSVYIDESVFSLDEMRGANRASIALDGVEDIQEGRLTYTDTLLQKVMDAFDVKLPKTVALDEVNDVAEYIIEKIILPQMMKK